MNIIFSKKFYYLAASLFAISLIVLVGEDEVADPVNFLEKTKQIKTVTKDQAAQQSRRLGNFNLFTSKQKSLPGLVIPYDPELEEDSEVQGLALKMKTKSGSAARQDMIGYYDDASNFVERQFVESDASSINTTKNTIEDLPNPKGTEITESLPTSNDLFNEEDLNFLQQSGAVVESGSGLIPGFRSSRGSSNGDTNNNSTTQSSSGGQVTQEPTPTSAPENNEQVEFTGQTRGYEIFYLMQPEAREVVEKQVDNLRKSRLQEIYLGVLTDGTFGNDFTYFRNVLARLAEGNREITLAVYLVNGPAMRRYSNAYVITEFSQIEPKKFRRLIKSDATTQETFRNLVRQVRPILEYNLSLNRKNSNIAVVMLEDNLDSESYRAMRQIAADEIADVAQFMRNPCPNCYEGNDSERNGDNLIAHDLNSFMRLQAGDAFSLDGLSFTHSNNPINSELTLSDISRYQELAKQKNLRFFALWKAERQGLYDAEYSAPEQRLYEVPQTSELEAEATLLQEGLDPINDDR